MKQTGFGSHPISSCRATERVHPATTELSLGVNKKGSQDQAVPDAR